MFKNNTILALILLQFTTTVFSMEKPSRLVHSSQSLRSERLQGEPIKPFNRLAFLIDAQGLEEEGTDENSGPLASELATMIHQKAFPNDLQILLI